MKFHSTTRRNQILGISTRARKNRRFVTTLLSGSIALATGLTQTTPVQAADGTWTGVAANNLWQDDANWSATPFPGTAGNVYTSTQTATFSTTGSGTIDLGGQLNIRDIRLGDGAGDANSFILGDANDTLNLSNAATLGTNGIILMGTGVTNSQQIGVAGTTISMSTTISSQNHFTNNSTTGAAKLDIAGNVTTAAASGTSILTLNGTNGGTVSGNITNGATASLGITKTGTGSWTLSGAGTSNTGSTLVNGGVLHMTAGNIGSFSGNQSNFIGNGSGVTAALRQSGGTLSSGGTNASFGVGLGSAYGTYELSGGINAVTNPFRLGVRTGQVTQTGGALNVTYTGTGPIAGGSEFQIGNGAADRGRVYATGGTVTVATGTRTGSVFLIGNTNAGTIGEVTIAGTAHWQLTGTAGIVSLGAANSTGTLNLNGTGSFTAVRVIDGGTGAGRINFDGGTLKAGPGAVTAFLAGLDSARIYSGGATIDDGGNTITIGQALTAPTGNVVATIPVATGGSGYIGAPIVTISGGGGTGATAVADYNPATGSVTGIIITSPGSGYTSAPTVTLAGGFQTGGSAATLSTATLTTAPTTGGLTKLGSGTMTLSAVNTYSGPTTVSVGTLAVTGSLANNGPASVFVAAPDSIHDLLTDPLITRAVAAATNYQLAYTSGLGSTSVSGNPLTTGTTAAILAGIASGPSSVGMQWRTPTVAEADPSNSNAVLSDVVDLTGVPASDVFVFQMGYNEAALTALILNETAIALSGELRLGWLNGSTWESAVNGNTGGTPAFAGVTDWNTYYTTQSSFDDGTDLASFLGSYGVDPVNNKVWAVLNHNSEFAVIPEPSTMVLGGLALLAFAGVQLRRLRKHA